MMEDSHGKQCPVEMVDASIPESCSVSAAVRRKAQELAHLNLFPSIPPSADPAELRAQRISTRVFISILGLSLYVLLWYISTVHIVKTVTVRAPDLGHYNQLEMEQSQTLICPCTKISMNYGTFLRLNHSLHQVCSSVYVTDPFVSYLANAIDSTRRPDDFRTTGVSTFQAMRGLCQLAEDSISINTEQFYSSNYVSSFATSATLFQSQSAALVQQFISSTTKNFLLSLRLIRNTTQANALLSTLFTNYQFLFPDTSYIESQPVQYSDGCTCDSTSACVVQSALYQNSSAFSPWLIPGFYSGCFVIEALLQSNLACFFNQSCVDIFHVHLQSDPVLNTTALDPALNTSYSPSTTIDEIVNQLMVEKWKWTASHGDYYAACQPKECTYTLLTRNDAIYIATAMFGLIGGLVTALKLLVPILVALILRKFTTNRSLEGSRCQRTENS